MPEGAGALQAGPEIMSAIMTATQTWALLLGIQFVTLPFYWRLPVPMLVTILIFTAWVALIALGRTGRPSRFARIMLLLFAIVVMTASYGTLLGREAGTGFLILLSFLKLFEAGERRDVYVVVFLNYFIIATNFFHTQSPWVVIYVFAVVLYLTSLLIRFSDRLGSIGWQQGLRISARVLLQATPLMLILFVLFPRIPGPLWGLPKDATTAVTGLSDDMSPGSLSSLIQSDEVAFRVRFAGEIPAHGTMYWRGPVFTYYDGWTWRAGFTSKKARPDLVESGNEQNHIKYTVTMEPHQRDWLFALEYPVSLKDTPYRLTRELQLLNRKKITNVFQYTLTSDQQAENHGLSEGERRRNLRLPDTLNPNTVALARQWYEEADSDARDVVDRALAYFRNEKFIYTLSPPVLGNDAMDDFLFESRSGFCEHYSSAFVYLMRAAGIPARVVTGYQGGEKNPVSDYIIVRQSSAHAWAEVWLEGSGWTRVDPTSAVSPDRIESGIQDAVAERDLLPAILVSRNSILRQLRYQWDNFSTQWNDWVVGFDQHRQRQLFQMLGVKNFNWRDLIFWLAIGMAIFGSVIAWWVVRHGTGVRMDRTRMAYDRFCNKLAKTGDRRLISDGPQEYFNRIKERLSPASKAAAERILRLYTKIRYGKSHTADDTRLFFRLVRQFRV
jgi:transglutaminase-like putative cysteine protease